MGRTAYGGVFLAPESIVIYPGLPAFTLTHSACADGTACVADQKGTRPPQPLASPLEFFNRDRRR